MRPVEIYIGTSLRGSAKGVGKSMYVMQTKTESGRVHERKALTETDGATESRLVLYALRDALNRFVLASDITVYTECSYIAAAINNQWFAYWRDHEWTTKKGEPVKDAGLWRDILWEWEDTGHQIRAEYGPHSFSGWLKCNIPRLYASRDTFTEVDDTTLNLVPY